MHALLADAPAHVTSGGLLSLVIPLGFLVIVLLGLLFVASRRSH